MSGERRPRLLRAVAATAFTLIGPAAASAAADTAPVLASGSTMARPAAGAGATGPGVTEPRAPGSGATVPGARGFRATDPGAPVPAPLPDVTVAVLGGGTSTDERTAIDYTIELRNDGPVGYRHLAVSALLPAGFRVLSASPAAGAAAPGSTSAGGATAGAAATLPTWTVDLAPGQRLDLQARIAAGPVQDLAEGTPAPLAAAAADMDDANTPGAQVWYSVTACVRRTPGDPPVTCGQSSQLLVKTDDDTRRGIDAIVLLLGLPTVVAALGAYAWRARRDPP